MGVRRGECLRVCVVGGGVKIVGKVSVELKRGAVCLAEVGKRKVFSWSMEFLKLR